jgi:hypothetical protein
LKLFIDCLLASADYESFYKVMVKEGRKLQPGSPSPRNNSNKTNATSATEAKADAKGSAGGDEKGSASASKQTASAGGASDSKGADLDDAADVKRTLDYDEPAGGKGSK